jgi:arylsulfatase A-like enzyme
MFRNLIFSGAFGLMLFMGCARTDKEMKVQPRFKNVVVIVGDDHAYKTLGCYGNEIIRTPNLDRLAQRGMLFRNAYANAPICSASRQSALCGKYPHATGVNLLFTPFNDTRNTTIAEVLKAEGISTAIIGKTHFNDWIYWNYWDEWPDYGFDTSIGGGDHDDYLKSDQATKVADSIPTRSNTPHKKTTAWIKNAQMLPVAQYDKDAEGTFFSRKANEFIEENKNDRFFLWLAFHEPHAPFAFPVEYADRYDPDKMPLPEGSPEDDRWIPEMFKELSEKQKRGIIASYYTSVEYMDKNVGIVLDKLEETNLSDSTLIIYFGDQGYLLHDHKRFEKHTMWKESIKGPLLISGNGVVLEDIETDAIVEFVDLAPTIFEAAGVEIPDEVQGKSLMKLLRGELKEHREYAFSTFLEDNKAMVASKKWKYIFSTGKRDLGLGYETGEGPSGVIHRLYDLQNDPGETTNLAYKENFSEKVLEMQEILLDRFMQTHPDIENMPENLNTIGRLIWFCEPRDVGAEPGTTLPPSIIQRIFEYEPEEE